MSVNDAPDADQPYTTVDPDLMDDMKDAAQQQDQDEGDQK